MLLQQNTNPGSEITVKLEAVNRSIQDVEILAVEYLGTPLIHSVALENNTVFKKETTIKIPSDTPYTTPYWLNEKESPGLFSVKDLNQIGKPETDKIQLHWKLKICEVSFDFTKDIVYKFNDNVKGETYQPFDILPEVTTEITNKVRLFTGKQKQQVAVKVRAGKDAIKGHVLLDLPADWKVTPTAIPFELDKKGAEKTVTFEVTPPSYETEAIVKSFAELDDKKLNQRLITIDYNHIPLQKS